MFRILSKIVKYADLSTAPFKRGIFSDNYTGLASFKQTKELLRLRSQTNDVRFKERIAAIFANSGLQNIFSEDLETFSVLIDTPEELKLWGDILLNSLDDPLRSFSNFPTFLKWFFLHCKSLDSIELAQNMWNNPLVSASGVLSQRSLRRVYLMHLYSEKLYDEVYAIVNSDLDQASLDDITIVIASLLNIGTKGAFISASKLIQSPSCRSKATEAQINSWHGCRFIFIYALFALRLSEYGLAFDTLCDKNLVRRGSMLCTNLKLEILVQVDRLDEALLLLRTEVLPPSSSTRGGDLSRRRPRAVCFETMRKLTQSVKAVNEGGVDMLAELSDICQALDEEARLEEQTIEELILTPIGVRTRRPGYTEREDSEDDLVSVDDVNNSNRVRRKRRRQNVSLSE